MSSRMPDFRPDLYIVSRIIRALVEEGPSRKTNLALLSDISYDRIANYLSWMVEKDLIWDDNGVISVTENGIKTYRDLVEWIVKYVGRLRFPRGK
jgi:predicted transcriptional regulator